MPVMEALLGHVDADDSAAVSQGAWPAFIETHAFIWLMSRVRRSVQTYNLMSIR